MYNGTKESKGKKKTTSEWISSEGRSVFCFILFIGLYESGGRRVVKNTNSKGIVQRVQEGLDPVEKTEKNRGSTAKDF